MAEASVLARPALAGGTVAAGQVVTGTSSITALVGSSNQAGTFTVKPQGVATTSALNGEPITVVFAGECTALAGDTIAQGDMLVAEYNTARVIPFADSAYTDGTVGWLIGRALEGGVDGQALRIDVNIQLHTVATAPA